MNLYKLLYIFPIISALGHGFLLLSLLEEYKGNEILIKYLKLINDQHWILNIITIILGSFLFLILDIFCMSIFIKEYNQRNNNSVRSNKGQFHFVALLVVCIGCITECAIMGISSFDALKE